MLSELIKLVFEKAKDETPNVTKTGLSKHVSKKIESNDSSKIFSYKTFTRYYDKYITGKDGIIAHPQAEIIEELCKYLGYLSYEDFVTDNKYKNISSIIENQRKNFFDDKNEFFEKAPKAIGNKKGGAILPFNKVLLTQVIFAIFLMSLFLSNWKGEDNIYYLNKCYKGSSNTELIIKDLVFKNAKNTVMDSSFVYSKR